MDLLICLFASDCSFKWKQMLVHFFFRKKHLSWTLPNLRPSGFFRGRQSTSNIRLNKTRPVNGPYSFKIYIPCIYTQRQQLQILKEALTCFVTSLVTGLFITRNDSGEKMNNLWKNGHNRCPVPSFFNNNLGFKQI